MIESDAEPKGRQCFHVWLSPASLIRIPHPISISISPSGMPGMRMRDMDMDMDMDMKPREKSITKKTMILYFWTSPWALPNKILMF